MLRGVQNTHGKSVTLFKMKINGDVKQWMQVFEGKGNLSFINIKLTQFNSNSINYAKSAYLSYPYIHF